MENGVEFVPVQDVSKVLESKEIVLRQQGNCPSAARNAFETNQRFWTRETYLMNKLYTPSLQNFKILLIPIIPNFLLFFLLFYRFCIFYPIFLFS